MPKHRKLVTTLFKGVRLSIRLLDRSGRLDSNQHMFVCSPLGDTEASKCKKQSFRTLWISVAFPLGYVRNNCFVQVVGGLWINILESHQDRHFNRVMPYYWANVCNLVTVGRNKRPRLDSNQRVFVSLTSGRHRSV